MKGLAICCRGIEDICALDIKELINSEASIKEGCVVFPVKDSEELCLLTYRSQCCERILSLIGECNQPSDLRKLCEKLDFSQWRGKSFRVSSKIIDNEISSEELNSEVGSYIEGKVDLENPDVIYFVYVVGDQCYLGVDFGGMWLQKRAYRIFHHRSSLRSTIAYALVRLSNYKCGDRILDCFMGNGTIPIEAGLFSLKFPVNYFRKERFAFLKLGIKADVLKDMNIDIIRQEIYGSDKEWLSVNSAKKNAKIAGINKALSFSRLEVEWLDTKFDKGSVNRIVTHPPRLSKNKNGKDIVKIYNEFFYQAKFILDKDGTIALVSNQTADLKKSAEKNDFRAEIEREVWSGKEKLKIIVFKNA